MQARPATFWTEAFGVLQAEAQLRYERLDGVERARRVLLRRLYLLDEDDSSVSLGELARAARISPQHFQRLFKRAFGDSPQQMATRLRLAHACFLLETSGQSVTEVCMAVGFSSLGTFSRRFSARYGCAPSKYRRRFVQVEHALVAPNRLIPGCFFHRFG